VKAIAGAIAHSVEAQGAATAEIARNVSETAHAATDMTGRIREVATEAEQTSDRASQVRQGAADLAEAVSGLRQLVVRSIRTFSEEVDRRENPRVAVDMPCRVTLNGNSLAARIGDLSAVGAAIIGLPQAIAGDSGHLSIDAVPGEVAFKVVARNAATLHVAFDRCDHPAVTAALRRHELAVAA
jgi:hypothetical protein